MPRRSCTTTGSLQLFSIKTLPPIGFYTDRRLKIDTLTVRGRLVRRDVYSRGLRRISANDNRKTTVLRCRRFVVYSFFFLMRTHSRKTVDNRDCNVNYGVLRNVPRTRVTSYTINCRV